MSVKPISARSTRWLKTVHIVLAGLWLGGATGLVAMNLGLDATSGGQLFGQDLAMKLIDDFVVIPAAIGTLITGLLYSIFTKWGFFKHTWVIVKWAITLIAIIMGTFFLGPWLNSLPPISSAQGLEAFADPIYQQNRTLNLWFACLQVATLLTATWLSVFKPWAKGKGRRVGDAS